MKSYFYSGLALSAILALSGCGGGGGGGSSSPAASTATTTSGTASDGYLSGSTVCFDANANSQCDSNEPVTTTNANGSYTLTIPQTVLSNAAANAPLLVVGGMDIDSKKVLTGSLRAPFTSQASANITPLSTMAHVLVKDKNVSANDAYAKVASALGLTADEVQADPVKLATENNNTKVAAAAMSLNRVVTMLAEVANDASATPDKIYDALSDAIESAAADTNNTNKSVGDIFTRVAEDVNSSLPSSVKEAAKVAPVIETHIAQAIENNANLADAAIVSDAVVQTVQTMVQTNIDSNTSIDETVINSIETNATQTASNVDVVKIAIKNIFDSYTLYDSSSNVLQITDEQAEAIKNTLGVNSSLEVTIEAILSATYTDESIGALVGALQKAHKIEEVKIYLTALGFPQSSWSDPHLDEGIAYSLRNFTPDMSAEDFSAALYDTGDPEFMSLALQISPPADLANVSDVQKAKDLFTSIRTQVNSVSNSALTGYADTESEKIDEALNNIAINTEFASMFLDRRIQDIERAIDENQTSISHPVGPSGNRIITMTQTSSSADIEWAYDVNQTVDGTETHWVGTVSFPDIDPETFDPSSFSTLHATLNGDLPLDVTPVTTEGVEDKQTVALDATITKTSIGADFALSASIASNGDSLAITDAKASVAYTMQTNEDGTKEPMATYVKLDNLYVNGVAGNYTLDGKLDVNAYARNNIMAAAGGIEVTTVENWVGIGLECTNATLDLNNLTFNVNGASYPNVGRPTNYYQHTDTNGDVHTIYYGGFEVVGTLTLDDVNNSNNYSVNGGPLECTDASIPTLRDPQLHPWTDAEPNNSGYLPSDVSFNGKLSNSADNSYFEGRVHAKWLDAVDANLSDEEYEPKLQVNMSGNLQMPESPLMKVSIGFDSSNNNSKVINTSYVYDALSVTANTSLDNNENGIINISASTGIKSTIKLVDGDIDYAHSTLTNSEGKTIGTFEDMSGAPRIKYIDGTFETLP